MTEHTPGPWTVYRHFATPDANLYDVVGATRDDDVAENLTLANAHLIAAAPDLLQAGTELADAADEFESHRDKINNGRILEAIDGFRAAIAKAEGRGA